jgi:hypothetical protein
MVLKYTIGISVLTEDFLVKIYEESNVAPGAEVYTLTVPAPHSAPYIVTASGLDRVTHRVKLIGATSGTEWDSYTAETMGAATFAPIRFQIGDGGTNTPAADTDTYTNSDLIGLLDDDYKVFRNNVGLLHPGLHYDNDTINGGFVLVAPDLFNDKEEFTIQREPQLNVIYNDPVVGKHFGGFVDVSSDTSYDPSHLRKLIRFSGTCTYTFGTTVPIGYSFCFNHYGVEGVGTIHFNAPVLWGATTLTDVPLASYQEAEFTFDGTNWNVVYLTTATKTSTPSISKGSIIDVGQFSIGDVPAGDPTYEVIHNDAITGDYMVQLTLKSNDPSTYFHDNKIGAPVFYHDTYDKPNRFHVSVQELAGETQNISIVWTIIKL